MKTIQKRKNAEPELPKFWFKKTVNSGMSFEPEGDFRIHKGNQTREFDPGSGRTLAACLTHASRAEILEELAQKIFQRRTGE